MLTAGNDMHQLRARRLIWLGIGIVLVRFGVFSPVRMRVFGRERLQLSGVVPALLRPAVLLQAVFTLAHVAYAKRQPEGLPDGA